jgi:hypothetical protein
MSHTGRVKKRRAQQDLEALSSKRIGAPRGSSIIQHIDGCGDIIRSTMRIATSKNIPEVIPLSSPILKEAELDDDANELGNEEGEGMSQVDEENKTQVRHNESLPKI